MSVAMLKSLAFTFCTPDDESGIEMQKRGGGVKSFSTKLETEYRPRIGLETWGDNKVYNNTSGDIKVGNKVDNSLGDDTVNGTVSGPLNGPLNGLLNGLLKDKVMNLIAEIPGVNRKDLVCRTGVSERTMTRNLSELERSGKIERRGGKKTGGYFLAEGSGEKRVEGQSK